MCDEVARQVVDFFRNQEQQRGGIRLLSIKVSLPEGCNAEEVEKAIEGEYPQYKAHSKNEKGVLAIGHR